MVISERTRLEMERGAASVERSVREERVNAILKKRPGNFTQIFGDDIETTVRVAKDGKGWSDDDVFLREPTKDFPSPTLYVQLMLLLG
jgi:hypothetical protein